MLITKSHRSFYLILEALKAGEVVVMACDTIYGLVGAAPSSEDRLNRIKGRAPSHPFIQLISHSSQLGTLQITPKRFQIPYLELWPGPFTLVLENPEGRDTAFRVPADERLRLLIEKTGSPLYSTSVNESGADSLGHPREIDRAFGRKVALVEDAGSLEHAQPSTVIDIRRPPPKLLRQGAGILPEGLDNSIRDPRNPN